MNYYDEANLEVFRVIGGLPGPGAERNSQRGSTRSASLKPSANIASVTGEVSVGTHRGHFLYLHAVRFPRDLLYLSYGTERWREDSQGGDCRRLRKRHSSVFRELFAVWLGEQR